MPINNPSGFQLPLIVPPAVLVTPDADTWSKVSEWAVYALTDGGLSWVHAATVCVGPFMTRVEVARLVGLASVACVEGRPTLR